ncbi:MAG: tryptophan synthase subunit alpha [Planctomycetia bacterium]|nr:tryptophan synthase subunit alpha [Planctomycetia bacterium]
MTPPDSGPTPLARLEAAFAAARSGGRKALAPFVTAGDPDPTTSVAVLEAVGRAGATLCELGVPYSDPIADGPVIQASYTRALTSGITLEHVFSIAREASSRVTMPILAMASYSLIFRRGIDRFVADARAAGLAGFVVPDLPLEESDDLDHACRTAGLALVRLVTPTTPPERAEAIARRSTGFLYCVAVAGVTGARTELPPGLLDRIAWLRTKTDVPILVGFGISSPDQVRAVAAVADGVIVGSALVRRIADSATERPDEMLAAVERFTGELAAACG